MIIADEQSLMMQRAPYSDGLNHAPVIFTYEQFKPVPGFDNRYFISTLGRLYDRNYNWHCKPTIGRYVRYYLKYNCNDFTQESAQKLMMITFKPVPDMENKIIVFLDQNPLNLVLDNMVWMTISERNNFLVEKGIMGGEKTKTIYTEDQINRVCMLLEKGFSPSQIKQIMIDLPEDGITPFNAICSRLKRGTSWNHVAKKYNLSSSNRNLDQDLIHAVCRLLSENKSVEEIAIELNASYVQYKQIKRLCSNLKARRWPYSKYTDQYPNIPYISDSELTDEEVDMAMQLKAQGYKIIDIVNMLKKNNTNIIEEKVYELFRRLKKDKNARGSDVARRYGLM